MARPLTQDKSDRTIGFINEDVACIMFNFKIISIISSLMLEETPTPTRGDPPSSRWTRCSDNPGGHQSSSSARITSRHENFNRDFSKKLGHYYTWKGTKKTLKLSFLKKNSSQRHVLMSRVAKFYMYQNIQTRFYPWEESVNCDIFSTSNQVSCDE